MEELGIEELQLLHEIRDQLVAMNDRLDAQARKRKFDSEIENRRKRTDSDRRATLIERLFARYNPNDMEFFDHIPCLQKRLLRIRRAGKRKGPPRSKPSPAKPSPAKPSPSKPSAVGRSGARLRRA
jgi:hypothetical protein